MKNFFTFKTAVLSGLLMSFFIIPTFVAEGWRAYILETGGDPGFVSNLANGLSLITDLLCIPLLAGFLLLSIKVENKLLRFTTIICVIFAILMSLLTLIMLIDPSIYFYENTLLSIILIVLTGIINVCFGIALIQSEKKIKKYAVPAGVLNILLGVSFVLVFTMIVGVLLLPPVILLELMILDRASQKYES